MATVRGCVARVDVLGFDVDAFGGDDLGAGAFAVFGVDVFGVVVGLRGDMNRSLILPITAAHPSASITIQSST